MPIVDSQLKSNDCGISAVKTIFNIYGKDISRNIRKRIIPEVFGICRNRKERSLPFVLRI